MNGAILLASKATTSPIVSTTWNPSAAGATITLSGGNLTMNCSSTGMVRSVLSIANGTKRYFEITITLEGGGTYGLDNGTGTLSQYVGHDAVNYGWYAGGSEVLNNATPILTGISYAGGDILGFAVDLVGHTVTLYKNGVSVGSFSVTAGTNYFIAGGSGGGGGSTGVLNTSSTISGVPSGSHNAPTGFQIGV